MVETVRQKMVGKMASVKEGKAFVRSTLDFPAFAEAIVPCAGGHCLRSLSFAGEGR